MQRRSGFSLLELLAVVTILGIVAAVLLPRVTTTSTVAKEKTCYHNRAEINTLVEQYYMKTGTWPASNLSDIGGDVNYFPQGITACPVSGQAYRLDVAKHQPAWAEVTLGKYPLVHLEERIIISIDAIVSVF